MIAAADGWKFIEFPDYVTNGGNYEGIHLVINPKKVRLTSIHYKSVIFFTIN